MEYTASKVRLAFHITTPGSKHETVCEDAEGCADDDAADPWWIVEAAAEVGWAALALEPLGNVAPIVEDDADDDGAYTKPSSKSCNVRHVSVAPAIG